MACKARAGQIRAGIGKVFALLANFMPNTSLANPVPVISGPGIGKVFALLANFIPDFDILGLGEAGFGREWQFWHGK